MLKLSWPKIKYLKVKKDDLIFTPPMEIHATYFPKNTVLIVSSKNPRDQITYENDTVRVKFINKENIKPLLKKYELIYPFFAETVSDTTLLNELKLDKKLKETLLSIIKNRIKIPTANLKFKVIMDSKAPNGLEEIKKVIGSAEKFAEKEGGDLTVKYISAPEYRFEFKHSDRKNASKIVEDLFNYLSKQLNKVTGKLEFTEIK